MLALALCMDVVVALELVLALDLVLDLVIAPDLVLVLDPVLRCVKPCQAAATWSGAARRLTSTLDARRSRGSNRQPFDHKSTIHHTTASLKRCY